MGFLAMLLPLLTGSLSGIKDWFNYKQQSAKAQQDYQLATLKAQAEAAKQQSIADSADLGNRLNATSQSFKQTTFWLVWVPIALTVLFPKKAVTMWNNLSLIPEFWYWLLGSMYTAIWALPKGYDAVDKYIDKKRDYKLEVTKIKYNRKAVFDSLSDIFPKGLTQSQVAVIDKALDAGERSDGV